MLGTIKAIGDKEADSKYDKEYKPAEHAIAFHGKPPEVVDKLESGNAVKLAGMLSSIITFRREKVTTFTHRGLAKVFYPAVMEESIY
jgi:hypothetical protein